MLRQTRLIFVDPGVYMKYDEDQWRTILQGASDSEAIYCLSYVRYGDFFYLFPSMQ